MNKQLSILVAALLAGCGGEDKTSSQATPVTSENGIWENGFTTNGIWENGIWENGIWENGIWENGIWENGIWENGIWENGIWENGIWENGIWENGIWENGIWENGIWENGIWENGWRADQLRDNEYAGALLQYIYSCAMPKYIDPNVPEPKALTIVIGPPDAQVTLEGSIGVGINADNTGWWESGKCDESCQRWVSACVLARTNAYGVHVPISLRAPDNAPQRIKDALATTVDETTNFDLPEGAFWGNIFQTTPQDATAPVGGNGPEDGIIVATPKFYACSGEGSNIPALTNRFCSSQGDDQVIDVVGTCASTQNGPGVCTSSVGGAHQSCYLNGAHTGEVYNEVITTYLKTPMTVCGDGVCEVDGETYLNCPTDCHDGGWTRVFADDIDNGAGGRFAVGPDDEIVVVAKGGVNVDMGGGPLADPPGSPPHDIAVAKYTKDGAYVWGRRIAIVGEVSAENKATADGVSILPDGTIVIVGTGQSGGWGYWQATLNGTTGAEISSTFLDGGAADVFMTGTNGELVHDAAGNLYVYGKFDGPDGVAFNGCSWGAGDPTQYGTFVARINTLNDPSPTPCWIRGFVFPSATSPGQLAIGSDGNLLFKPKANAPELYKLSSANGNTIWTIQTPALPVRYAVDPGTNDILIAGTYDGAAPLAGSPASDLQPNLPEFFLARLNANDGSTVWTKYAAYSKLDQSEPNAYVDFDITRVAIDTAGNGVLVAGLFGQINGGLVNFGAGNFYSYAYDDPFLLAYSLDSEFRFAKQVPLVLEGLLATMAVDSRSHIVMSGDFGGSMLIDGQFVVNDDPLLLDNEQTFVSSFPMPGPDDLTAPVMQNKPLNFTVQATSAQGAPVWYMPPTAIDPSGATVLCTPKPNAVLSLGPHTITCKATDIHGNQSTDTFTATVIDTRGPAILINADVVVEATGPLTPVNYPTPTATDQVSGATTVICTPASGTSFPVGSNHVTCTSTDGAGNTTTSRFVTVIDTTAPTLTLPGNIAASATSSAGATVSFAASASDLGDGSVPVVCDHPSGSTFAPGTTTVNCSATDTSGNSTNGSFTVTVAFQWGTILQPINADGSSIFKLGSTVAVRFTLGGASAGVQTPAHLSLRKLSSNPQGSVIEAVSTGQGDTGNWFRYTGGTYTFNLSTQGLSVGTWELIIDLHDGTTHTVNISLRP